MRVPVYERQEQLQGLPDARQRVSVGADNFLGATQAAVLGGAEEAAGRLNHAAAEIYSAQQQEMYQARALDGRNQTQQFVNGLLYDSKAGVLNLQGADAFQPGADGLPPRNAALQQLQQHIAGTAEGLGNDESRRLYLEWANAQLAHVDGLLQQHEGQQARVYQKGVNTAAIAANAQTMANNYNNPELLGRQVEGIYAAAADQARLDGLPPQLGHEQGRQAAGNALQGAIDRALQLNDHAAAMQVLKQFSPHMETGGMMKAYQAISQAADATAAYKIANGVMGQFLPLMNTPLNDQAFNLVAAAESGGRQFAGDGSVLTSPRGAKGKAQVMPDTGPEAARLAGLPWQPALFNRGRSGDAAKDAEAENYNFQLGHAYFNEQLRAFKGDPALAFAAYNAGPGAVREALQQSLKQGGSWLSFLPKETQAYVASRTDALAAGQGRFEPPTLAEAVAAANRHIDQAYGDTASPQLRKQVVENVAQQFELQRKALQQRDEEGLAEAYRQLQANGGSFSALPLSVRNAIPPDKVDNAINFAGTLARGVEPKTDWALYYRLRTDRRYLKSSDLMAFRDRLADAEFKQLADLQQRQAAPGTHSTSVRTAADILQGFMAEAGIDPNPDGRDREKAAVAGRVWSVYEQRVADFEALHGKKAAVQDLEKIAGQMFTQVPVRHWYGNENKPAVLVDSGKDRVVVPEADRRQIVEALRQTYPGRPISEDDVWMAYMRGKGLM